MTQIHKNCVVFLLILLMIGCAVLLAVQPSSMVARAMDTEHTNVLDDLEIDPSFFASHYPAKSNDFTISIVNLAESIDKHLFVYVYQPSGEDKKLTASSINISTTINDEISFFNFKLELLNSNGTLFKYMVKDFEVKSDTARYYAITSIYRPFDASIDSKSGNDNTVNEVEFAVNKQYSFSTINGKDYCNVVDIETIVVTDKFVGFVRYSDGFHLYAAGACDSHFVAFNTDKPIDKLIEADVYYEQQSYRKNSTILGIRETFGDIDEKYAYLEYTDKVEHTGSGLFAGTYTWDRIESVDQFMSSNNLSQNVYSGILFDVGVENKISDKGIQELQNKEWVLRFAETVCLYGGTGLNPTVNTTRVGNVSILRLKFETDGVVYNLGVIDNKQTGGTEPINEESVEVTPNDNWKWLLSVIAMVLLLVLLYPILPYVFKLIFWIISLPFRAVKWISKSIKNNKKERKAEKER